MAPILLLSLTSFIKPPYLFFIIHPLSLHLLLLVCVIIIIIIITRFSMSTFHAQSCRGNGGQTSGPTHAHTHTRTYRPKNPRCACAQARVNKIVVHNGGNDGLKSESFFTILRSGWY